MTEKMHRRSQFYKVTRNINFFMYMDDVKICVLNEKELESLKQIVTIFIQYTEMKFGIGKKCAMLL